MDQEISSQQLAEYQELFYSSPVQTQDDRLKDRLKEHMLPYLVICALVFFLFLFEIYRWVAEVPPMPYAVGVFFLMALGLLVWQLKAYGPELRFLRLGRDGEPDGQSILNRYVESTGGVMFSDVEIAESPIDYVIINQHGVLLVNLADWRTPSNANAVIEYDDREILFNGYRPDHNPVEEVRVASAWLENRLHKSLGHPIEVLSIIVFPGWFIQRLGQQSQSKVRVVNPRELKDLLKTKRILLSDNDNCLLNYHVSKIIKKAA